MAAADLRPVPTPWMRGELRADRIRLRTLVLLRWTAVFGQSAALLVAWLWFRVDLNLVACVAIIAASLAANLAIMALYPARRRLDESEALAMLVFDAVQLVLMLAMTGGMHNPFTLLVLAPVTIAATALRAGQTMAMGALVIAMVTGLALYAQPMRLDSGQMIAMPRLFVFGHWLAVVIGVVFLGLYARRVAVEMQAMEQALFATQLALAREQRLCDLGGVVAAAAHELGTPLATIKLTSAELARDLAKALPDSPELAEDAALIRSEADRCSAILHGMGRAGKDDLQLRRAPLEAILREAAEPHLDRGATLHFVDHGPGKRIVARFPELIHGLRNMIQNAVDFAKANVWVECALDGDEITIRISDDGPGFPVHLLPRIGDPFLGQRRGATDRPGYDGMGLGLFIAKTLLERTGARLRFSNGADPFLTDAENADRAGAIVEVIWPRDRLEIPAEAGGLGENPINVPGRQNG